MNLGVVPNLRPPPPPKKPTPLTPSTKGGKKSGLEALGGLFFFFFFHPEHTRACLPGREQRHVSSTPPPLLPHRMQFTPVRLGDYEAEVLVLGGSGSGSRCGGTTIHFKAGFPPTFWGAFSFSFPLPAGPAPFFLKKIKPGAADVGGPTGFAPPPLSWDNEKRKRLCAWAATRPFPFFPCLQVTNAHLSVHHCEVYGEGVEGRALLGFERAFVAGTEYSFDILAR